MRTPNPIHWDEYLTVEGGSVTIHCVIEPKDFGSGILAGSKTIAAKRQLVGHIARNMVAESHPKPGEVYAFSFLGRVVKVR